MAYQAADFDITSLPRYSWQELKAFKASVQAELPLGPGNSMVRVRFLLEAWWRQTEQPRRLAAAAMAAAGGQANGAAPAAVPAERSAAVA